MRSKINSFSPEILAQKEPSSVFCCLSFYDMQEGDASGEHVYLFSRFAHVISILHFSSFARRKSSRFSREAIKVSMILTIRQSARTSAKRNNSSETNQDDFNSNKVSLVNDLIRLKSHSSLIESYYNFHISPRLSD
jgi:hypothetical protein